MVHTATVSPLQGWQAEQDTGSRGTRHGLCWHSAWLHSWGCTCMQCFNSPGSCRQAYSPAQANAPWRQRLRRRAVLTASAETLDACMHGHKHRLQVLALRIDRGSIGWKRIEGMVGKLSKQEARNAATAACVYRRSTQPSQAPSNMPSSAQLLHLLIHNGHVGQHHQHPPVLLLRLYEECGLPS